MSKIISISGKDYHIEYTYEASLYNECVQKTILLMTELSTSDDYKKTIASMSDIPLTTLHMFHAGLLEHHGIDGDGSIESIADTKKLLKTYFAEHKDDDTGNAYGFMELLVEQMGEDGFFKQIGLEQMIQASQTEAETKKKKTTKKALSVVGDN